MHPIELPDVFRGRDAVEAGALTLGALRGAAVRRLFTGVYAPRSVTIDHELRCRAVALLGEGQLVLTGRSAATVLGVPLSRTLDDVEVIAIGASRVNRRPGLDVRRVRVADDDHEPWREIRIATAERLTFDVMARGALTRAVVGTDQILRAGVVSRDLLERYLDGRHDHGVVQARRVLELVDGRASPHPSRWSGCCSVSRGWWLCHSTWCATTVDSWHGSTSPSPTCSSPSSTTAAGTPSGPRSRRTASGSTDCSRPGGRS